MNDDAALQIFFTNPCYSRGMEGDAPMDDRKEINPYAEPERPAAQPPEPADAEAPALSPAAPEPVSVESPAAAAPAAQPSAPPGPVQPSAPPAGGRRRSWLAGVALVATGALVGAAVGTAATLYALRDAAPPAWQVDASHTAPITAAHPANGSLDAAALYAAVAPGVVKIERQNGEGTGFIIDGRGYILTNYHVVGKAKEVAVLLDDGARVTGRVQGADPSLDLAVVKIDPAGHAIRVLPLGDSDRVRPGEPVVALGFPLSRGKSISAGIVSGLGRVSEAPNERVLSNLIQTDAAINPGNSGGPLINAQGQVIGVNTQIASPVNGFTGIGFAVPINAAKAVLDDMVAGRKVEHPWLGIVAGPLTREVAEQMGLQVTEGILVTDVLPNSPAAAAGLRAVARTYSGRHIAGDVITAVDGRPVRNVAPDLTGYLDTRKVGDQVTLTVIRDGEEIQVPVTLAAWPDQVQRSGPELREAPRGLPFPWPFDPWGND